MNSVWAPNQPESSNSPLAAFASKKRSSRLRFGTPLAKNDSFVSSGSISQAAYIERHKQTLSFSLDRSLKPLILNDISRPTVQHPKCCSQISCQISIYLTHRSTRKSLKPT